MKIVTPVRGSMSPTNRWVGAMLLFAVAAFTPQLANAQTPESVLAASSPCGDPACSALHPCGVCVEAGVICAPPVPASAWVGGFEFLWMRANFDENVALIIDPPVGNTSEPFDYGRDLSPRAWLGWESGRGGGLRATYFRFDDQADDVAATAVVGATPVYVSVYGAGGNLTRTAQADLGETLQSQHRLELETLDLEATHRLDWYAIRGTVGAGVRLARMDQLFRADVSDAGGTLQDSIANDLRFEGAGPTLSLQAHRGIGATPLSVYGGFRGSLLMCETDQAIYEMRDAFTTELEDVASQREVLTALEMSIGLQWNQSFGDRIEAFARTGYECQAWLDAGGPIDADSTIGFDAISLAIGLRY